MVTRAPHFGWHTGQRLRFYSFQHPYVCTFVEELIRSGIDGLLTLPNQSWYRDNWKHLDANKPVRVTSEGEKEKTNFFDFTYAPNTDVVFTSKDLPSKGFPTYNVDFADGGAYSQYNWELFFHIPLFIATKWTQDQQYDKAMKLFHYIFNPTTDDTAEIPKRYWFFEPFRDLGEPESIKEMMQRLAEPAKYKDDIQEAIREWREHPFEPHRIARRRPGAYQKTVLMKYLDMLIAWGDQLFSRDTIESINEATQLYVLAAKLLGPRPQKVTGQPAPEPETYLELRSKLDDFSNAMVQMENVSGPWTPSTGSNNGKSPPPNMGLYFCIPHNEKLLDYWDTVEDRLFKIRHCMNIEGIVRELPLFEPPIDPALLVRARALGLNLASVLDDLSAPLPHYRFTIMLQKAREFCEELKQLGGLLLSAVEKKDAEKLALIRAQHEKELLEAVREVKKQQIKEAENTYDGLQKAKELVDARAAHYTAVSARLPEEKEFLDKQVQAIDFQHDSKSASHAGSVLAALTPTVTVNTGTLSGTSFNVVDAQKAALIAQLVSDSFFLDGENASTEAATASYKGQLIRSQQDRDLQIRLATIESEQLDKQIAAADIRRQIAENELTNHEKQIEHAGEIEDFLREKFTNQELYNFMVSQVSAVYFQAYKLAYDLAKRAERVYRHELGITESSFVQFGAWDNLRKGLLAGERLSLNLRRLEHAYLEKNKREFEITKPLSLRQLDPVALLTLKATGKCEVTVPEWFFDMDTPGHYMRRIKSVALSIPCVVGPYSSVNCTLSLLKSSVRKSTTLKGDKYERQGLEDNRFVDYVGAIQSIVTSGGNSDSGLFEANLRDERFLPFEGAGAMSTWRLELPDPQEYPSFDYATISDIILHFRYTARQGVPVDKVKTYLHALLPPKSDPPKPLAMLFSLRHDFPSEWSAFVNGADDFSATIRKDYIPYFAQRKTIIINDLELKRLDFLKAQMIGRKVKAEETSADTASKDLADPKKQSFTFVASEDKEPDPSKNVLVRAAADVWIVISYSLQ